MDSNSPNSVEQFNGLLSRCKAEKVHDNLLFTVSIKMKAGSHTFKKPKVSRKTKKLPFGRELQGRAKAFNMEEESEYSSSASGFKFEEVYKQAQVKVCEIVVGGIFQSFTDSDTEIDTSDINRSLDSRSQLKMLCDKITVQSMDAAFMETIQLKIKVIDDVTCSYNGKGYTLLKKGDEFEPSCFDVLKDAKNKTFGLAYDKVRNNLGPAAFAALHRGPKTFNNEDTIESFVDYFEVVGSDGKKEHKECFNCFGHIFLPESYDKDKTIYLPLEFKQLCQKAVMNLNNITVEEVASQVTGNETLYREMSVIFKSGASNNKRQKIVPFPDNILNIPKTSPPRVYPPPHVPKTEDLRKHLTFEICSDEEWTIEVIDSAQRMIEIGDSEFIQSKVLGIDFEADHDRLALMTVTNYDPDRRIFILDLVSNEVRGKFPSVFGKMLENPEILKIGHSLRSLDRPKVFNELDCMIVGMFDTQILYKLSSQCETIGLHKVLSKCGIPTPANRDNNTKKAYQLWNWCKRPIDKDALSYAAMDVAHLAAIMTFQFNNYHSLMGDVLMQSNTELSTAMQS